MLHSVARRPSHVRCGLPVRQPPRAAPRRFRAPGRTQWGFLNARPNASVRSCITTSAMRVTQWWPQRVRFSRSAVACALTEGPAILCSTHIHSQQRFALMRLMRRPVCMCVCVWVWVWVCATTLAAAQVCRQRSLWPSAAGCRSNVHIPPEGVGSVLWRPLAAHA